MRASLVVGSGGAAVPLAISGALNDWVTAPDLDKFRATDPREMVAGALAGLVFYRLPKAVSEDYLSSYEGDRMVESMRYVRSYPEEIPVLLDLLPHSKLDILNVGHFTWEDAPDDYADLVINWWDQAEADGM